MSDITITITEREREILNTIVNVWGSEDDDLLMHGHASYSEVNDLLEKMNIDIPEGLANMMSGKTFKRYEDIKKRQETKHHFDKIITDNLNSKFMETKNDK